MQIFLLKEHVKFRRMTKKCFIQSMLHRLLYIFPIFWALCEYHANKFMITTPFCCDPFIKSFFHIFVRTNQSAAQQVRDPSMQTSANWKEPSLVSKSHRVEPPSWVLPTCREPVWPYVMENREEMLLCVAYFSILAFFEAGNVSNRSIIVGNV